MKLIDFDAVRQAMRNMSPVEWYAWVDDALRHKADFLMPPKSRMSQAGGDYYNSMPVMYEKENIAAVKMIGRHSIKRGEARSVMLGDIMLYEADTGILKALIDAEYITTIRTGVVAAHSALLFVKNDFAVIGLLGLGNIMTVCFQTFLAKLRASGDNRQLTVKLYCHHGQEERFACRFGNEKHLTFIYCDTCEEVMAGSDLILSAVTKATDNFAPDSCYKEGVTIVPICTMGFQNCDLFFDKVFTDDVEQIRGFKYFDKFKSLATVTDVLNGIQPGRKHGKERILVYDYGLAIHDLYFAHKMNERIEGHEIPYQYCQEKYFI